MSPMNNRRMTPMAEPGILDFAPGAAAAYSLRNLSLSYVGPVVTVRRSTDDAEADFTASEVSDGTLAAWCSGGDGFVKTWHDQSQYGRDALQGTSGYQPQIVDSGALITEGGKAAVQFDGVDDKLIAGATSDFNELHSAKASVFSVLSFGLTASPNALYVLVATSNIDSSQVGSQIFYDDRSGINSDAYRVAVQRGVAGTSPGAITHGNAIVAQETFVLSQSFDLVNATADERLEARINAGLRLAGNTNTASPSAANSTSSLHIGSQPSGLYAMAGTISELLIYPTDQTALRTRIEGNLAWTYNA